MVFVFICKEFQKLSIRNVIWLSILAFVSTFFLFLFMHTLVTLRDSMANIISVLEHRRHAKTNTKRILLLSQRMRENNRLTECKSSASNCILTENKALFGGDLTLFDAIVFDESQFTKKWTNQRLSSQLYVITTIESPSNHPACELQNDDFFNWTFTYRLDSDIIWKFFVVKNLRGDILAPSIHVQWNESKQAVPVEIKAIFQGRNKAAAWIVSNCDAMSRNKYLTSLQEYLYTHSLHIDVFGGCTKRKCKGSCKDMLRKNYFFYMAFENSFNEDYVTEKVLHGYDNYVVPIVYGGANYSRFLPMGSYIDARKLHPYNLAHLINHAMKNPKVYESYFHWTNFYTIDSDYRNYHPACDLCEAVNSDKAKYAPAKKKFRFWWNTLNGMKWCLPGELWYQNDMII